MMDQSHRNTIFVEEAEVVSQIPHEASQFILRVSAPKCAASATPSSFAHVACHPELPMRRPLSIMRASPEEGWVEFLYKIVGHGLQYLSQLKAGDRMSILGPIGQGFRLHSQHDRPLMIGGGVGIPPMVFLAESIRRQESSWMPLVLMGSEIPFPFQARPSTIVVHGIPDGVIAGMPLLDSWGIASRLASGEDFPGCYQGFVTDLAREWLSTQEPDALARIEIFACGPTPMLKATAELAHRFGLACQLCLEEYMACAVGGCAGCTVLIQTPNGPAMKRVCVDGPVFEASAVYPQVNGT
jgi:dihydroorotate dehydrogenase electron transfer subunit